MPLLKPRVSATPANPELLPIPAIDWERLVPLIGPANRALAQFNGVLYGVPNPDVLLSPLTMQEAVLSSRIEGTQATLGEVLEFEAGEEPEQEARRIDIHEILNYRGALLRAEDALRARPFNLNLLLELHSILLDSVRGRDKARGRFRTIQNWIGTAGCAMPDADFVPPDPGLVPSLLDNWEKYYHSESPDILVQLAIVHAQFEIIHPFLDGNGRLGRILIPLFLFERQMLSRPVFYLSEYIEQHKDEYILHLRELGRSEDSWNHWIEFFLRAVVAQAEQNTSRARAVLVLYERLKSQVISLTRSQFAVPLLDFLFGRPIFSTTRATNHPGLPSKQMTLKMLNRLREANIIRSVREGSGRRAQIFAFTELLNLCEGRDVL